MRTRLIHLLLALLTATGALALQAPEPASAAMTVQRLAGADRYATAAAVSAAHFPANVPVAYVATGADFPDALAGGPVAARAGGPILLVPPWGIPPATANELARLRPARIVVLGGTASVSDSILAKLDAYDTGGGVSRLAGADRYGTAAAVSAATFAPGVPIAFVATGTNFPDALAGGVAAARLGGPVLLTKGHAIPGSTAAELRRLLPARIVVLGSTSSINSAVATALNEFAPGAVSRIGGADRYATAALVSATFIPSAPALFVASGRSFPDALVAVPAAHRSAGSLLLVPGTSVPSSVRSEAARLRPSRLVLLGGYGSINDRVTFDLRVALGDLRPLPACTYQDVLTPFRAYTDWHRSLLDTILMLPSSYAPGDLVDSSTTGLNAGYALRRHVAADLAAMASAARAAGAPIQLASAYRSYAAQQSTFNYWVSVSGYEAALRKSARAGHSEHQLGTTFDVTSAGGRPPWEYADWATTPAGAWMAANAWRYGFVMSYPRSSFAQVCYDYEPWHYRYVGRDLAARQRVSGLTLRELLWLNGSGG